MQSAVNESEEEMDCNIKDSLIQKETLYAGSKYIPLVPGTKVKFHYETRRADNQNVIDDSRKIDKPLELVLGKKFKMEVLEVIVQKMTLKEVAKFTIDKSVSVTTRHYVIVINKKLILAAIITISICIENNS